ncbi:SDR family oxidoreductase [Telmatospirillum siberiense]|uniref:DUF2867 domain-containing protein n=1 Tax=Telmatospirillum siberiense TaxID=382514 RepID=A0A2N3PLS8_9PROT|nr:SDR family oxidoreductase [Telmatospirillum siberiense]PKU21360.1 DUF2867 domain-containing protein [Telmatospirillum siberiense]
MKAVVFGATGYVGTNLVPALQAAGHQVTAVGRRREALEARGWTDVACLKADALQPESLPDVLAGADVAYYLVHSMAEGDQFPELDRRAAVNFREAAGKAGLKRIVYLGALQPAEGASIHLASRRETGEILREGPVPVTELRAGIIIGPGSAAFEVIRDLVFHLPAMVTPRWVSSLSQPIALDDIETYLVRLPGIDAAAGAILEAGGPQVLSYADMMRVFGELVGRHPRILPVPLLSPHLSSLWLSLVTSVPANVARALIGGLEHDLVVADAKLSDLIPLPLKPYREAVEAALEAERSADERPRWVEGSMLHRQNRPDFGFYAKHLRAEGKTRASAEALWGQVGSIGGDNGYYFLDVLWQMRGFFDLLVGGVGMRRGRPAGGDLAVGDALDFWRVIGVEKNKRLTLLAEMRIPGSATFELEIQPLAEGERMISVTAHFHPAGVAGITYWNALLPIHKVLFRGLIREIIRRAEQDEADLRGH